MICAFCQGTIADDLFYYYRNSKSVTYKICRDCKMRVDPDQMITNRIIEQVNNTPTQAQSTTVQPTNSIPSTRITLDFCIWVQASFDDLIEEINKGVKVFKASSSE